MQGNKLYVGNLSYSVTQEELRELFAHYGGVVEVRIIPGRDFAFVEMSSSAEAESAKQALDGCEVEGRALRVAEARPPRTGGQQRGGGGGYGGGRGRGGYRRY